MNTIKDKVIIRASKEEKAIHAVPNTDIKLHILTEFREFDEDVCTQSGEVIMVPMKINKHQNPFKHCEKEEYIINNSGLKSGDKVYCHHHLTHEGNDASILEPDTYALDFTDVYCRVVDGGVEMLGEWNLLEPIEEGEKLSEGGLILNPMTAKNRIPGIAIMRYPSKGMQEDGITDGTKVSIDKRSGYLILVEGKKYYRVINDHILAVYGEE